MELTIWLKIVEIVVFSASIGISAYFILKKMKMNKNLETIKYLSVIRKEIWELMEYKKMKTFVKDENAKNNDSGKTSDSGKVRALKQKLEYMSAAINNDDLSVKLVKNFCGRWFHSAVRILEIGAFKKEEYEIESNDETKELYNKLNKLYNNN